MNAFRRREGIATPEEWELAAQYRSRLAKKRCPFFGREAGGVNTLGAANSFWKRAAATARGRPFSFILSAARFSESHWMETAVIMRAGFDATIGSNERT